ncbi:hypothetical protein CGLO_10136 [Colletotrichum gloeosporioides Cg-14]|uniref:Uncharacterized protein n=1 Tax=Colletotrichum gloeosporioides (strain Cg-14) TaxID=1237896 RepID=T0LFU4_COLGC|nr:hypothetical protein CGLO_10136 [Colletotrichum gloeosporioides Cg-14]
MDRDDFVLDDAEVRAVLDSIQPSAGGGALTRRTNPPPVIDKEPALLPLVPVGDPIIDPRERHTYAAPGARPTVTQINGNIGVLNLNSRFPDEEPGSFAAVPNSDTSDVTQPARGDSAIGEVDTKSQSGGLAHFGKFTEGVGNAVCQLGEFAGSLNFHRLVGCGVIALGFYFREPLVKRAGPLWDKYIGADPEPELPSRHDFRSQGVFVPPLSLELADHMPVALAREGRILESARSDASSLLTNGIEIVAPAVAEKASRAIEAAEAAKHSLVGLYVDLESDVGFTQMRLSILQSEMKTSPAASMDPSKQYLWGAVKYPGRQDALLKRVSEFKAILQDTETSRVTYASRLDETRTVVDTLKASACVLQTGVEQQLKEGTMLLPNTLEGDDAIVEVLDATSSSAAGLSVICRSAKWTARRHDQSHRLVEAELDKIRRMLSSDVPNFERLIASFQDGAHPEAAAGIEAAIDGLIRGYLSLLQDHFKNGTAKS